MVKEHSLVFNQGVTKLETADEGDGLQLWILWRIVKNVVYK